MKKVLMLIMAIVMCLSFCACGGGNSAAVDTQELIAQFGDDGDGNISWEEGSFPYFIDNKESFELLSGTELQEKIVGTWTIKDKFGTEFKHTFNEDFTATTEYFGNESNCYWAVDEDGYFYFGTANRAIDTEKNLRMELRQVEDDLLVIYVSDTGSYDGNDYEMTEPYAILYK